jgi:hypothetical protein
MSALPDVENHVIVQEWAHAERRRRVSRMPQIKNGDLAIEGAVAAAYRDTPVRLPDCGRVGFIDGALPAAFRRARGAEA